MKWIGPMEVAVAILATIISSSWFLSRQLTIKEVKLDNVITHLETITDKQDILQEKITNVEKDIILINAHLRPVIVYDSTESGSQSRAGGG